MAAKWKQRLGVPSAPEWARGFAWYRVEYMTRAGTPLVDAARPIIVLLTWLDARELLAPNGQAALAAARSGEYAGLAVARPMLVQEAAEFMDSAWAGWWDPYGADLIDKPDTEGDAVSALDLLWRRLG